MVLLDHVSDRGSQYLSIRYSERLAEASIEPSVGSRGDSYDNALAERDHQQPVQDRTDAPSWAMENAGVCGDGNATLGALVQPSPTAGTERIYPPGRS